MSETHPEPARLRELELSTVTTTDTATRSKDPIWIDRPADPSASHTLAGVAESEVEGLQDGGYKLIDCPVVVNTQRQLNHYFRKIHRKLVAGGHFTGKAETLEHRWRILARRFPRLILPLVYFVDFLWKRVLPKLSLTRRIHYRLFPQTAVVLSTTELLGRLVYCGFEIEEYRDDGDGLWFRVRKAGAPLTEEYPPSSLLFSMNRLGKDGQPLRVYKIRTMHPYAHYLQAYVLANNGLHANGKFSQDFRITRWGRFFRENFVDELPMLYNLIRGELKVFGVRPISEQYASLYPEEVGRQRLHHKPGLVPPFYFDMPNGFGEIVASEKRYMDAYEARPLRTDLRYLCIALFNIVFRHARSS